MGKNRCTYLICFLLAAILVSCKNEVETITLHDILFEKTLHQNNNILFVLDSLHFCENTETEIQLQIGKKPVLSSGDFGDLHILTHALLIEKNHIEAEKKYKTIHKEKSKLHPLTALILAEYELKNSIPVSGKNTLKEIEKGAFSDYYKGLSVFYLGKTEEEENHQIDGARILYEKALTYFQKTDHITPAHQECIELLTIHSTYQRKNLMAIRYANAMFDFERYLPKADVRDSARAYANRAFMVFREGDFEACKEDVNRGLSLINKNNEPELYQQLLKSRLVVHMLRQEDSLWFHTAEKINQNIKKTGKDYIEMNRWIGQYFAEQKQYKTAVPFLKKALKYETEKGNVHSARYSTLCFLLSLCYENLEDYDTALYYMAKNEGFEEYTEDLMKNHIKNDKQYSFVGGLRCANIYFSKYKKEGDFTSLQHAKSYTDLIDKVMFEQFKVVEENAILQFYFESGQEFFHLGMDIHFELWKKSGEDVYLESFINYSDKNKNSLLYRDIQMAHRQTSLPEKLVQKEFQLRAAIKEEKRKGLRDNHRFNVLMDEYTLLESEMESKHKTFTKEGLIKNPLKIHEVKKMIKNKTNCIFMIDETQNHMYYTLIKKDSVLIEKANNTIQKNILIDSILASLKLSKKITYQKAFAPILLPQKIASRLTNQIYYITDGIYHRFPLEAILYNPDCRIVHMPSMRLYDRFSSHKNHNSKIALFAFSDKNTIRSKKRTRLAELPGTYTEVMDLSQRYNNVTACTGSQATKNNFLKAYQNPDIHYIHLALHGIANSHEKDDVKLYFRTSNGGLDSLYGYELLRYKSTCKKIVLSACQSGLGMYEKGEGLFSLPRYFMLNGATEVTFHYWDVED
jgi:CHAT domain-containing protein